MKKSNANERRWTSAIFRCCFYFSVIEKKKNNRNHAIFYDTTSHTTFTNTCTHAQIYVIQIRYKKKKKIAGWPPIEYFLFVHSIVFSIHRTAFLWQMSNLIVFYLFDYNSRYRDIYIYASVYTYWNDTDLKSGDAANRTYWPIQRAAIGKHLDDLHSNNYGVRSNDLFRFLAVREIQFNNIDDLPTLKSSELCFAPNFDAFFADNKISVITPSLKHVSYGLKWKHAHFRIAYIAPYNTDM